MIPTRLSAFGLGEVELSNSCFFTLVAAVAYYRTICLCTPLTVLSSWGPLTHNGVTLG